MKAALLLTGFLSACTTQLSGGPVDPDQVRIFFGDSLQSEKWEQLGSVECEELLNIPQNRDLCEKKLREKAWSLGADRVLVRERKFQWAGCPSCIRMKGIALRPKKDVHEAPKI